MTSSDHWRTGRTLLRTLVDAGEFDCAEVFARTIPDPTEQSATLALVARTMADAGERDSAAQLITQAEILARTQPKCEAFIAIAQALDSLGERHRATDMITEAEAIVRSAMKTIWPGVTLAPVALALAKAGEFDRAEAMARDIPVSDMYAPNAVWTSLACVMAEAGEFDRAEAIARDRTRTRQSESETVTALVEVMVEAGEFDRAEALVRSIANPYEQPDALRVLAASDYPRRAAAMARILALTSWHDALDIVARLEPAVVDTILTELDIIDRRA